MEVDPARQGIDSFSQSGPKDHYLRQGQSGLRKASKTPADALVDDVWSLPDQPDGTVADHRRSRLHRQPYRGDTAGSGPRAAGLRRFQQQQPDRS